MPRFYFDTADGKPFRDDDGAELADLLAAKTEVYRILTQMIPLHQHRLMEGEAFTVTMSDAERLTLLTVEVVTTLSPALARGRR